MSSLPAQPQLEPLGRGVAAIHQPDGRVAVCWRLLGTDPDGVAFNLYRKADAPPGGFGGRGPIPSPTAGRGTPTPQCGGCGHFGGDLAAPRKLNDAPLTGPTLFVDDSAVLGTRTSYFVRPVVNGVEREPSAAFTVAAGAGMSGLLTQRASGSPTGARARSISRPRFRLSTGSRR